MVTCTVGVLAYNEEHNICQILQALLSQRVTSAAIVEIVVVASGCTDRTVALAEAVARVHPIIKVEVQAERAGKAAATNRLITIAQGEVLVLAGADTLPDPLALDHLLRPFANPSVGMTGGRIVPLNDPRKFLGFSVQMLWQVHHHMALRWPKLGELVAFRKVIPAVPVRTATDEVALEALLTAQGYELVYVPEALVYNRGPQSLGDFVQQRRRIFAGHLQIAESQGYVAASMPMQHLFTLVRESLVRNYRWMFWLVCTILLEAWARVLGTLDYNVGHSHHIWRPIRTTKQVHQPQQSLTLLALKYSRRVRRADLMQSLRRIPAEQGTLFWWDHRHKEVIFMLPLEQAHQASVNDRINALASYLFDAHTTRSELSYRLIEFAAPDHTVSDMAAVMAVPRWKTFKRSARFENTHEREYMLYG